MIIDRAILKFACLAGFLALHNPDVLPASYELRRSKLVPVDWTPVFPDPKAAAADQLKSLANPTQPYVPPRPENAPYYLCTLLLTGPIDAQTPKEVGKRLADLRAERKCNEITVSFNSAGGDVEAAISVGRYLRRWQLRAYVAEHTDCGSACVLAFVGGVNRAVAGKLVVHRPYATDLSQSYDESQAQFSRIRTLVEVYLREMNVPASAAELILTIPSSEARHLDAGESASLGFAGRDPAYQDQIDSSWAAHYGVTKADYYFRRRAALVLCSAEQHPDATRNCYTRVLQYGQ